MQELLKKGLFIAIKLSEKNFYVKNHGTLWICGKIIEVRDSGYRIKVPFNTSMFFKKEEVDDLKVL